jgi:phage regulator Rha-like protein
MNNLVITIREEVLVVDSKLVADELGIQHKNFLATIDKYTDTMAQSLVVKAPAFETRVIERPQGGTYEERICWLTEPQAIFLMTLSRNTERVVSCKLKLVEAFEAAKQRIATLETTPATNLTITTITAAIEQALTPINQRLDRIEQRDTRPATC